MEQRRVGSEWYVEVRVIDRATGNVDDHILFGGALLTSPEHALEETLKWLAGKR